MNDAPALVDRCMLKKPFDRPLPRPPETVLYLLRLLGGMNMNGAILRKWNDDCELFRRYGTKRMRSDANDCTG
ncbi:hypothetical protein GCM10011586_26290 [Silvibacterium dinghuense]|nr:hypothetical protein GCM10011586_26290 [Silvibacterium dinghuense]